MTGLGAHSHNTEYKTGSIAYEFGTKTQPRLRHQASRGRPEHREDNHARLLRSGGLLLQHARITPESSVFPFSKNARHEGTTSAEQNFSDAEAENLLASLCAAKNAMNKTGMIAGMQTRKSGALALRRHTRIRPLQQAPIYCSRYSRS